MYYISSTGHTYKRKPNLQKWEIKDVKFPNPIFVKKWDREPDYGINDGFWTLVLIEDQNGQRCPSWGQTHLNKNLYLCIHVCVFISALLHCGAGSVRASGAWCPPPGLSSLTAPMDRTTTEISIGLQFYIAVLSSALPCTVQSLQLLQCWVKYGEVVKH